MVGVNVETGVDKLVRFLQTQGKVAVKDVSTKLEIPEDTLQLWIDFLVEERVIGLEYKFTKPYIFLNETKKATSIAAGSAKDQLSLHSFKDDFFTNALHKQLPESKIPSLWKNHLAAAVDKKKDFFLREANTRGLKDPEHLFEMYKKRLLEI